MYSGDNSYSPSSESYSLLVTPAPTFMFSPDTNSPSHKVGSQVMISVTVNTSLMTGVAPTGTIVFYDGGVPIQGAVALSGTGGNTSSLTASLTASTATTFTTSGTHQITAQYSGDTNYSPSNSGILNLPVLYGTTVSESLNPPIINLGQSITITATVTGSTKTPPMTGTLDFSGSQTITGPVTTMATTDASGNRVLISTLTLTPPNSLDVIASYSGDSNYAAGSFTVSVNVVIPFILAPATTNFTIPAGQTGTTTLTVTPASNVSSAVAVSCSVPDRGCRLFA